MYDITRIHYYKIVCYMVAIIFHNTWNIITVFLSEPSSLYYRVELVSTRSSANSTYARMITHIVRCATHTIGAVKMLRWTTCFKTAVFANASCCVNAVSLTPNRSSRATIAAKIVCSTCNAGNHYRQCHNQQQYRNNALFHFYHLLLLVKHNTAQKMNYSKLEKRPVLHWALCSRQMCLYNLIIIMIMIMIMIILLCIIIGEIIFNDYNIVD